MISLHLLRHGQTAFGAGDCDRLSPLGEAQARTTAPMDPGFRAFLIHVYTQACPNVALSGECNSLIG
jgi:hypothetical protein